jgi:hypothetical protein
MSGLPGLVRWMHGPATAFRTTCLHGSYVWDALSSDRPYWEAWEQEEVLDYLRGEAGKHFGPNVVDVFLGLHDEGKI